MLQKTASTFYIISEGEISVILCLTPIMIVETFSALVKLLGFIEAEYRVSSLLSSKRLAFLTVSRSSSESAVHWAKESEVPVNDAMMASVAVEHSALVYTADENHFRRLKKYGLTFRNPIK
jgi:predicted nucleic acid-binding protein